MRKAKTGLWILAGALVSIVAIKAFRKQRKTPRDEARAAVEDAVDEAGAATEHATAAAGHARIAGEKAIEHARQELETPRVEVEHHAQRTPPSLRKVGKGLMRR